MSRRFIAAVSLEDRTAIQAEPTIASVLAAGGSLLDRAAFHAEANLTCDDGAQVARVTPGMAQAYSPVGSGLTGASAAKSSTSGARSRCELIASSQVINLPE